MQLLVDSARNRPPFEKNQTFPKVNSKSNSDVHRAHWHWRARIYDRVRKLPVLREITRREMANVRSLLAGIEISGKRVLDVGAGTGTSTGVLPATAKITALDQSWEMLQRARTKNSKITLVQADARCLPFKTGTFDLVLAVGVLEYVRGAKIFMQEIRRVLHPPGYLLLTYSPKRLLNLLRIFWGQPTFLLQTKQFARLLAENGFVSQLSKESLIQIQHLICVKKS